MTSTLMSVSHLQAADGKQDELVSLLAEFAITIHAEPGCVHYSVHRPTDDKNGPLTVVQAYSSAQALSEHAAWMQPNISRLAAVLAAAPQPPIVTESVRLDGDPKESF